MSKRQENLKKSLGISEYPWSSDDDEHGTTPVVSEYLLRRHENETRHSVADMPGTSASVQPVQTSELSPTSRRTRNTEHTRAHAKIDRDTFWSLVNSTHRISVPRCSYNNTVNNNRGSMSISPVMPHNGANSSNGENVGRRSTSDVILTFKKLNRNLPCRSTRSATNLLSIQRAVRCAGGAARSSSSTLFSRGGAFSTDLTAIIKAREHRRSRNAQQGPLAESSRSGEEPSTSSGISRSQPLGGSDNNPDGIATMEPINIEHSEEEAEMPPVALSPIATNDNETQMQEGESHNTTAMSVEEEVVEIDAEPEGGPAAGDAAGPDGAQAPDGETANESNEAAQQPHGVKRKRDAIEESEPSTVKEFNQNLLRLLECPVCLEWMEPPMSQCRRGHLVCGRCRARLASCPVCRTAFSSVRNRAMEGVAEMLRYPCRHGCGREVRLRRRGPHEASCGARRYRCPACPDRSPLPHRDLAPHFQSKHLPILKIGRKHRFSMKVNSEQHDNWMIMALHELFHLRVDVDIRTWGVVVYVAYIGPMCKANNFTYEVIVTGQHNSRKLTYTRETHSDLESSSLTVSRQDCFHLTIDQALNFLRVKNRYCEPDKFLNFTVEITQAEGDANRDESDS